MHYTYSSCYPHYNPLIRSKKIYPLTVVNDLPGDAVITFKNCGASGMVCKKYYRAEVQKDKSITSPEGEEYNYITVEYMGKKCFTEMSCLAVLASQIMARCPDRVPAGPYSPPPPFY